MVLAPHIIRVLIAVEQGAMHITQIYTSWALFIALLEPNALQPFVGPYLFLST
jgi:hypothetical protein